MSEPLDSDHGDTHAPVYIDRRDPGAMQVAVTAGVVAGMRQLMADPEVMSSFWKRGFEELSTHSSNGASQWFGKRLLTIAITAATTAGIVWLVKTGAIK